MNHLYNSIQISRKLICNNIFHRFKNFNNFSTTNKNQPKFNSWYHQPTLIKPFALKNNLEISKIVANKPELYLSSISTRKLHSDKTPTKSPKTPDLIYFPHVFRWLKTKFWFKYLKSAWDPTFSEGAFIYGSTQAICRITEIISSNQIEQLDNLLTPSARIKLIQDMTRKMTRTQREIMKLTPKDIKILVPMSVQMKTDGLDRHCKIALRVLALKWFPQRSGYLRLVLVALQSEFLKDYTKGIDEDWNVSGFDVLECTVLTETTVKR